jgi:FAD/FMN-containing dehydrogenase/Fe-S oxidoreductase
LSWAGLEADLRAEVSGEVRFDAGTRGLYASAGGNYRLVPIGVVVPRTVDDVIATVAVAARHEAPLLSRGGGTSLAGQCANVALVMDFSKYLHGIVSLDPERGVARVQPGLVLDRLREAAERHHLTFAPDPATHDHCTLGGMIGNNSCGVHSVMAGKTVDNVLSLDVLTYDGVRMTVGPTSNDELSAIVAAGGRRGQIYADLLALRDRHADAVRSHFPKIPRRVSGYNLDQLLPEAGFDVARALVGTEGTCVTVLEAEVRLVPSPPARSLLVLGYPDVFQAADDVLEVLDAGPIGLEGMDQVLVDDMRKKGLHTGELGLLPEGHGWLLVEFGGQTKDEADDAARRLMKRLTGPTHKLYDDLAEERKVWELRESGLGATALVPGSPPTWEGWEDAAVPPSRLGPYLRDFRALLDDFGYGGALYGHFGDGCVHTRIDFDLTDVGGIARYRSFVEAAADLVVSYGGSLSGEHGDGQSRAELLPRMFGPELIGAFEAFKAAWDPGNHMNPGKVVHPRRLDDDLRLGAHYRPREPVTFFAYGSDEHSFAKATLRCVGVGKCRREGGGTMCPSYMVTREEKDSTRGRARLLFEMLQGDVVHDGWRSEAVRDALDLCLACKGCRHDCPVNVDMATYKAEFLAHHYAGRLRPRSHYSLGWLPLVARAASRAPRLANGLTHAPGLAAAAKWAAGVAPQRSLPRFAPRTFRAWFESRVAVAGGGRPVVLWPDTFTDHFDPHIGVAAVEVLEAAGFSVVLPPRPLCCGLTWISTGQLKTARRVLQRTVDSLAGLVEAGLPVVGLEPSCTAVFRSDLAELLPRDTDAERLARQTVTLAELLQSSGWRPPPLPVPRRALVQGHCHHQAIMGMDADAELWRAMALDADLLDSGCCGLAGNFGVERGHYDVSMACGERVLLPAVRAASESTIVMADGFSCRTQIAQATGRRAQHSAEVLAMALHATVPSPDLVAAP